MIYFPTGNPHCPRCGKRAPIITNGTTTIAGDDGDYDTESMIVECATCGKFEVMQLKP